MSASQNLWLIIVAIAVGTLALRLSFILLAGKGEMRPWIKRALQLLPAAVLAALAVPALLQRSEDGVAWGFERLVAGLIAGLVAWRTKSMLLTIITGMAALWGLQLLA